MSALHYAIFLKLVNYKLIPLIMVIGNEHILPNVEVAMSCILDTEAKQLAADSSRTNAPEFFLPLENPLTPQDIRYPYCGYFNDADNTKFIMTGLMSGRYALKPNLKNRKFLFRGESEFHDPCKPNLFRNVRQKYFFEESIKFQEMHLLILSHPLVQLLDTGIQLNKQFVRLEMNLWGLSQHYFNRTSLLDLTSDPEVAMFFATTEYDCATDSYSPITDENHAPGILYFYALNIMEDFKPKLWECKPVLTTIGLQVFPRSGSQKGFIYEVEKGANFNQVSRLNAFRFKHDAGKSQAIFDKFNGGEKLFPTDILASHWKQYNRDSKVISNRTVLLYQQFNENQTVEKITQEITALGYEVKDYLPSFTQEELDIYYENVKTKIWPEFCNQIHIPGDDGSMMQALLNIPNDLRYQWAFEPGHKHVIDHNCGFLMKEFQSCLK